MMSQPGLGKSSMRMLLVVLLSVAALTWSGCKSAEQKHYEAGKTAAEQGDYNKAVQEFELALAANPNNVKAHFRVAEIYKDHSKSLKKAREHFRKVVELQPTYATAWEGLKDVYLAENDVDSAIIALQDGLKKGAWDDKPDRKEDIQAELQKMLEKQKEAKGAASGPAASGPAASSPAAAGEKPAAGAQPAGAGAKKAKSKTKSAAGAKPVESAPAGEPNAEGE
ncbi:MAG: tetratricopeptide repeat protein [Candidatus Sumerlaeota bacterium]|nr:tetratricopeptide repeat protein [Candidatus Sumerlaeota bacterium]